MYLYQYLIPVHVRSALSRKLLQESDILDIIIRIVHRNGEMHEWIKKQVQLGVLLAFRLSS